MSSLRPQAGVFSPDGSGMSHLAAALRDDGMCRRLVCAGLCVCVCLLFAVICASLSILCADDEGPDSESLVKAFMSQTHTKGAAAAVKSHGVARVAHDRDRKPGLMSKFVKSIHPATNVNPFMPLQRRHGLGKIKTTSPIVFQEDGKISRFYKYFELLSVLGSGSFSDVFRCRSRIDGCAYAVKRRRERVVLRNGGWNNDGAPNAARRLELKEVRPHYDGVNVCPPPPTPTPP
jgi:hypothetical protein